MGCSSSKDETILLNEGIILVKPHCSSSKEFVSFVKSVLSEKRIQIVFSGEWTGKELSETGTVDKHYGAIANRALHENPNSLKLDQNTLDKFETTFGVKWDDAVSSSKVYNLNEALKVLSNYTGASIATACASAPSMKLLPGTYVAHVEGIYIINGFYMNMVSSWKQDTSLVLFYLVQWKEEDLSWSDFRSNVIGSTDPSKADPKSIRGILNQEYNTRFGLNEKPTTTLNGVHASAGPIEGARECTLWAKKESTHKFLLEKCALKNGVSTEAWNRALNNDFVALKDGKSGLIFDVTEGYSASRAIEVLKEL